MSYNALLVISMLLQRFVLLASPVPRSTLFLRVLSKAVWYWEYLQVPLVVLDLSQAIAHHYLLLVHSLLDVLLIREHQEDCML